jgi:hypothetical protein
MEIMGGDKPSKEALKIPDFVIPAKAGIQKSQSLAGSPLARG